MTQIAAEESQPNTNENQISTMNEDIAALVRSITKEGVIFLLQKRYGFINELRKQDNIETISGAIESHGDAESILSDLIVVRNSLKEAEHEIFFDLCIMYNVNAEYDEPFSHTAIKCLLVSEDLLSTLTMLAAVAKKKDLESYSGKPVDNEIELNEDLIAQIKAEIQRLIDSTEPGRTFTINAEVVDNSVLLSAYFAERTRTITQFTSGKQIKTTSITPALEAQAKYNSNENRLYIKGGRSAKIKNYLLESFGNVFFDDNTHFTDPSDEIYNLEKVTEGNFSIPENADDLPETVESASIIEEVLIVPTECGEPATVIVKHGNVEAALREWSNENLDWSKQMRKSITIQLVVLQEGKRSKKVNVNVANGKALKHDPKFSEVVHKCLVDWGLERE